MASRHGRKGFKATVTGPGFTTGEFIEDAESVTEAVDEALKRVRERVSEENRKKVQMKHVFAVYDD